MQLFALDNKGRSIFANHALKQTDYSCSECGSIVRLRGGIHRQKHFYHLMPPQDCRQHGKGLIHLQVQMYLLKLFPEGECRLEERFHEISRIADVAWASKNIVFEIQCAAISAEEVLKRNADYEKAGWKVIWILHDHRYNHHRLTAAEHVLKHSPLPFYFTNINQSGVGRIYDQFDLHHKGFRIQKMSCLPVEIRKIKTLSAPFQSPLTTIRTHTKEMSCYFEGDLIHEIISRPDGPYIQEALKRENDFLKIHQIQSDISIKKALKKAFYYGLARPYKLWFQIMLERLCR